MNDDFLTRFRKSPSPEFAATLYERISKPMTTQHRVLPRLRLALTFAAIVAMLTITLAASPGVRALAADLLRQIGVLTLSDRPIGESVVIAPPSPEQLARVNATATPLPPPSQSDTPLEVAIARAGFQPYWPGYVPAGYTQVGIEAAEYVDDQHIGFGMGIFITYLSKTGGYLSIQTTRFDQRAQDIPIGGHTITDVSVGGQPGVWIEDLPFESSQTPSQTIDMLLWQEDDFVLAIQTDRLPLDKVLRIAESLNR